MEKAPSSGKSGNPGSHRTGSPADGPIPILSLCLVVAVFSPLIFITARWTTAIIVERIRPHEKVEARVVFEGKGAHWSWEREGMASGRPVHTDYRVHFEVLGTGEIKKIRHSHVRHYLKHGEITTLTLSPWKGRILEVELPRKGKPVRFPVPGEDRFLFAVVVLGGLIGLAVILGGSARQRRSTLGVIVQMLALAGVVIAGVVSVTGLPG